MITEEDKDKLIATLTLQLQEKEKEIEDLSYEKSIKHLSLNRDLANSNSEEMQKYLTEHIFKDKFKVCCPSCGEEHECEFNDIKFDETMNGIYISCKNCPRTINEWHFPQQAIKFYKTMYELTCYEKHQDYLCYRNHISTLKQQDKISFCIEQLEKVKELILKECFEVSGRGVVVRYYVIYHIFDNQIKQLKEGK